jgi:hypothetical protein
MLFSLIAFEKIFTKHFQIDGYENLIIEHVMKIICMFYGNLTLIFTSTPFYPIQSRKCIPHRINFSIYCRSTFNIILMLKPRRSSRGYMTEILCRCYVCNAYYMSSFGLDFAVVAI